MSQTRIGRLFDRLRAEQRAGLIAYITAGDPSLERTPDIIAALERGGVDLIERGVPSSDPIADGPAIQAAADRALKAGANVHGILDIASRIRQRSEIPLLLFTYMNPVLRYGLGRLGRECVARGIDGCLLTDLCRGRRSEEHTSELQSPDHLLSLLLLQKNNHLTPTPFPPHPP